MSDGITDAMRGTTLGSGKLSLIKCEKDKDVTSHQRYSKGYADGFKRGEECALNRLKEKYEDDMKKLKKGLNGPAKDIFDAAYYAGKREGEVASDAKYQEKINKMEKILQSIVDLANQY